MLAQAIGVYLINFMLRDWLDRDPTFEIRFEANHKVKVVSFMCPPSDYVSHQATLPISIFLFFAIFGSSYVMPINHGRHRKSTFAPSSAIYSVCSRCGWGRAVVIGALSRTGTGLSELRKVCFHIDAVSLVKKHVGRLTLYLACSRLLKKCSLVRELSSLGSSIITYLGLFSFVNSSSYLASWVIVIEPFSSGILGVGYIMTSSHDPRVTLIKFSN